MTCVHQYALAVALAKDRVRDTEDIDTHYSSLERLPDRPHGCYDGVVYIGNTTPDENGDETEVVESLPCRRCNRREM